MKEKIQNKKPLVIPPSITKVDEQLKELNGGGKGKRVRIVILEDWLRFKKMMRRAIAAPHREIHFGSNEEEVAELLCLEYFDMIIWVGWGVPPDRSVNQHNMEYKEWGRNPENAVRKSFKIMLTPPEKGIEFENPSPYIIAIFPREKEFMSKETCEELGIKQQIVGPPDSLHTGEFKKRLKKAVEIAEQELGYREKNFV